MVAEVRQLRVRDRTQSIEINEMTSQNEDDRFDLNIDELFNQLAELMDSPINSEQAYFLLLLLWGYFEVFVVEDDEESHGGEGGSYKKYPNSSPNIIQVEKGYQIFDYGSLLKTSSGKFYGSYTTGRLLTTVKSMIDLLIKRGAKQVNFNGLAAAKRFAWIECEKFKIKVNNFTPDNQTLTLRDRLPRLDSLRNSFTYTTN